MGTAGPQGTPRPSVCGALCAVLCGISRLILTVNLEVDWDSDSHQIHGVHGAALSAPPLLWPPRPLSRYVLGFRCPAKGSILTRCLLDLIPTLVASGLCLCRHLCLESLP